MTLESFREQVILAAHHEGGVRLQPCLAMDPAWFRAIQSECARIVAEKGSSKVTDSKHPTYWTRPYGDAVQFSLFNKSGDTSDTSADHLHELQGKTFALPQMTAVARLGRAFEGRLINLRLNGLAVGSGLSPHEETIEHGEKTRLRFHLPVFSNDVAVVLLDERKFSLREGIVYFFNNGCVHSAENHGDSPRYHLVWDVFLDEWIWEHVCDPESASVPAEGFRKLTPAEVAPLMRTERFDVDEFVRFRDTGAVRMVRRRHEGGESEWVEMPTGPEGSA